MPNFFDNLKNKQLQSKSEPENEDRQPSQQYFEKLKTEPEFQQQQTPLPTETFGQSLGRHALRTGTRGFETLAGMAGDVVRPAQDFLENFISKAITGKPITEEQRKKIKDFYAQSEEGMQPFPTSQEIREAHEPFTKEYLKPQSQVAEISDEVVQDIVSQFPAGLVQALIGAALGQGIKQAAKEFGVDEGKANLAKSATMFFTGLFKPKAAKELASSAYAAREAALPVGVTGDATKLESKMLRLANNMRRSGKNIAPSEKEIAEAAENIVTEMKGGQLSYQKAASIKRSLNEKAQKFLFETPDKAAKARARNKFKEITHDLEEFISTSEKSHPKFYKAHKEADRIFGTLASGRKISTFLEHNLPRGLSTVSDKIASAIIKPGMLMYHMVKSPELRKLYTQILGSAAMQNAPQMNRNFRKLAKASSENPEIQKILEEET